MTAMPAAELTGSEFDDAVAAAGIALTPEDRDIALGEARNLHRAAVLVRAYVADAERCA